MKLQDADWSLIPDLKKGLVRRYLEEGIKPDGFHEAMFSNDLKTAYGRADFVKPNQFYDCIKFLCHYAPRGSYGSPENYQAWIAKGGLSDKPKYEQAA